jgi:hypothetical protein
LGQGKKRRKYSHSFGQNAGIQNKMDKTSTENDLRQIAEGNEELQTEGQMELEESAEENCRCV